MSMRRVVLAGGPGSGKTTVLGLLAQAGYEIKPDVARNIISDRRSAGLSPRPAPIAFAQQILGQEIDAYPSQRSEISFHERGVGDAVAFLLEGGGIDAKEANRLMRMYPYSHVFLFPPWEAIYKTDSERDHTFEHSVEVYDSTKRWYEKYYPDVYEVPRSSPEERCGFILEVVHGA